MTDEVMPKETVKDACRLKGPRDWWRPWERWNECIELKLGLLFKKWRRRRGGRSGICFWSSDVS